MGALLLTIWNRWQSQVAKQTDWKVTSQKLAQQLGLETAESQQILSQVQELKQYPQHIIPLHDRINTLSRKEDLDEVCQIAVKEMIDFFGLDYASLSLVNHLDRTIKVKYNIARPESPVDPAKWQGVEMSRQFSLSDRDVLPYTVARNCVLKVEGAHIQVLKELQGEAPEEIQVQIGVDPHFDAEVYRKHGHDQLLRLFIPMEKRLERAGGKRDYALGVFEVGYHKETGKTFSDADLIELKLYIDNCAQPFFRGFEMEEDLRIKENLDRFIQIEDPDAYLQAILEELAHLVHAEMGGDVALVPFGHEDQWLPEKSMVYKIDPKVLTGGRIDRLRADRSQKEIYQRVTETSTSYWTSTKRKDAQLAIGYEGAASQLSIPLRYQGRNLGVLNLYDHRPDHFDMKKARVLEKYAREIAKDYTLKRVNYNLQGLVRPFGIFEADEIYQPIVSFLKNYFQTPYIIAWERQQRESIYFQQAYHEIPGEVNLRGKEVIPFALRRGFEIVSRNGEEYFLPRARGRGPQFQRGKEASIVLQAGQLRQFFPDFRPLLSTHGLKSGIFVPVISDTRIVGLITLFSKVAEPDLAPEDYLLLNMITQKGGMTLQMFQIINQLTILSEQFSQTPMTSYLQSLTEKGAEILEADLIQLFPFSGKSITRGAGIHSGSFLHKPHHSTFSEEEAVQDSFSLANAILRAGTQYFSSKEAFEQFLQSGDIDSGGVFERAFWEKEKLAAMAAIRLSFQDQPLGVLLVHYRYNRRFEQGLKTFIKAFRYLTVNALITGGYMEKAKVRAQNAEDDAVKAHKDKEGFEKVYFTLAQGINHDIRNNLIEIAIIEDEIKEQVYPDLSRAQKGKFQHLFRQIGRNAKSIEQLLDKFEFRNRRNEVFNVKPIIRQNIEKFRAESQRQRFKHITEIRFEQEGIHDIPMLEGDPQLFSMIVYNLLSNSVKAIDENPDTREEGLIRLANESTEDTYILTVCDNGVGIDNTRGQMIFDYRYSDREDGIGLGLYFVREILDIIFKGNIHFESSFGKWTKFFIKIPL
ncbi:MAG: GAF domain-containing sensor histidine kinase [Bacteroidota bacterium]